jgi:DNA-binding MarR family transcriptional regulator
MTTWPDRTPPRGDDRKAVAAPLPWLLRRVNQRYRAAMAAGLADAGLGDLPQPGYWALMALHRGVAEASQLVTEMGVSKQAVSKLVDTLVANDYVERKPHGADRRRIELRLTDKGRKAVKVVTAAASATERRLVAELGSESFALLTRLLEQLAGEVP